MPLPPPDRPPTGFPPVLWSSPPGADGTWAELRSTGPGSLVGRPFAPLEFRDVILDTVIELRAGDGDTGYGLFLRQVAERSYLAFTVTPDGRSAVFVVDDGHPQALAEGVLPPDAPFSRGTRAANRLTVVAAGPSLTCIVNGFVLVGVIVDPRFKAGVAGALLVHAGTASEAALVVRWAEARAILPGEH
jgi:hypothetical protein